MTKTLSLLLLRVSLGGLLLVWGVNKNVNVDHSQAIADNFCFGFLSVEALLPLAGAGQMLTGLLVVIGLARRWVYPLQLFSNAASLSAVGIDHRSSIPGDGTWRAPIPCSILS